MLVSEEVTFEAGHRLVRYHGERQVFHRHTWRLRATVEAPVGPDGLAFDFVDLRKEIVRRVVDLLSGRSLNEIIPQPSAENLSIWIWKRLEELPLREVRLWITPTSSVTYRGPRSAPVPGGDGKQP